MGPVVCFGSVLLNMRVVRFVDFQILCWEAVKVRCCIMAWILRVVKVLMSPVSSGFGDGDNDCVAWRSVIKVGVGRGVGWAGLGGGGVKWEGVWGFLALWWVGCRCTMCGLLGDAYRGVEEEVM